MLHLQIITVGKHKESWLIEALAEYEKRLQSLLRFSWKFCKNNDQLEAQLQLEKNYICLDSRGKEFTSEEFSETLFAEFTKQGSKLCLVIGGAEGLSPLVIQRAKGLWSFSKMTLTHQQIRLLLLEQIYRAFEINRGSKYHK